MDQYRMLYNKNYISFIAVMVISLLEVGLLFALLLALPEAVPELIVCGVIISGLLIIIASINWVLTKVLTIPCVVIINESGIKIELERKSWLYPKRYIFSSWEDVTNISETNNTGSKNFFYEISCKKPLDTANLSAVKKHEDEENFFETLTYYQDAYNFKPGVRADCCEKVFLTPRGQN